MKKLSILISLLILVFSLNFLGCNSKSQLLSSITDARVDVYSATSENLTLTCNYGYTVNKDKVNYLSFRLNSDPLSEITYTVKITLDKTYSEVFTLNPVTHTLTAKIYADLESRKSFDAEVSFGSTKINFTLNSILPEKILSIEDALKSLEKTQPSLIENYLDEYKNFTAKLSVRVIVKNNAPYYYVAITDSLGEVKALLLNGITGEVLAVREIF